MDMARSHFSKTKFRDVCGEDVCLSAQAEAESALTSGGRSAGRRQTDHPFTCVCVPCVYVKYILYAYKYTHTNIYIYREVMVFGGFLLSCMFFSSFQINLFKRAQKRSNLIQSLCSKSLGSGSQKGVQNHLGAVG